jgi:hypothetical protein
MLLLEHRPLNDMLKRLERFTGTKIDAPDEENYGQTTTGVKPSLLPTSRPLFQTSRSQDKGRPDRSLSSLRYLTVSVTHRRIADRLEAD